MVILSGAASCLGALLLAAPALAASNPWLGTWILKLSAVNQKPETLIYSDAGGGAMRMVSVEDRSEIVTHFDGKPALDTGGGAADQHALALTSTSSTSYSWTLFKEGKPWVSGRNILADDRNRSTRLAGSLPSRSRSSRSPTRDGKLLRSGVAGWQMISAIVDLARRWKNYVNLNGCPKSGAPVKL